MLSRLCRLPARLRDRSAKKRRAPSHNMRYSEISQSQDKGRIMFILQFLNGKSTDSNDLPSEVQEAVQILAEFAPRQHPPGPAGPEEFEGVEINFRNVGTALSRQIKKNVSGNPEPTLSEAHRAGRADLVSSGPDAEHNHRRGRLRRGRSRQQDPRRRAHEAQRHALAHQVRAGDPGGFRPCRSQASWLPPGR